MGKPDARDAELILKIYELRREKVLREARAWFSGKFEAASADELRRKYPPGSQEDAYFRQVVSFWDMVGALVYHKTVNEELFLETNREYLGVWRKAQPIIEELRQKRSNPRLYENLEYLVRAFQRWSEKQPPKEMP
jgi:hypothetical protein